MDETDAAGRATPALAQPRPARFAMRAVALPLALLRRGVEVALILLLASMFGAVLAQIAGRYVFNFSIAWATEFASYAQIWMVLLGAGYAMRTRQHVAIDTLVAALPPMLGRLVMVPILGLCLWFLWVVWEGGWLLLEIGQIQTSAGLGVPMTVPYAALPASAAYLALETLIAMGGVILGRAPIATGGGVRLD
jgi:TRAP-type C4-dicarboxylate transport system permease small subunit